MNNIIEVSRRSMINSESGVACGPFDLTAIDAEIVINDQKHIVFLHAQWVSEESELISFSATLESLYDVYDRLNKNNEDFDELCAERDRIVSAGVAEVFPEVDIYERYGQFYKELVSMIQDVLMKNGFDVNLFEDEE